MTAGSSTAVSYLVTGGSGFIGAALVRRLLDSGAQVRVLDNHWRGPPRRLAGLADRIEIVVADVRNADKVAEAVAGVDRVIHLSAVNGTRFFYEKPELVIDVAIRGMLNVIDACRHHGVRELFVASTSEAYQSPPVVPTPEDVPLVVPDVLNPRYSYGGSKIASELIAFNYGRNGFDRVVVFRPHNVYGPDMGFEHVIPELTLRAVEAVRDAPPPAPVSFALQGDGEQTRAFIHIDDFIEGLMTVIERGAHLNVYHIGNPEEITVKALARAVLGEFGRIPVFDRVPAPAGETRRRCPDIGKVQALGWTPRIPLSEGLGKVVAWYRDHADARRTVAGMNTGCADMSDAVVQSRPIVNCQICNSAALRSLLFLGYVPPVNTMPPVGERAVQEPAFPLELFRCEDCGLAQIGLQVAPEVLFPYSYPYLSGTTRILRDNFADLYREAAALSGLRPDDLVVDIGSNDGTLLANFKNGGHRVLGIEPSQAGEVARSAGIETLIAYFSLETARQVREERGAARIITAANVFAHIGDVHNVAAGIVELLSPEGVFISESHYLLDLVQTLQYDTIYHEHLRYYALGSLGGLLERHGLEVFHVKRIPTHGGSIRVYAGRPGKHRIDRSVAERQADEAACGLTDGTALRTFRERVVGAKLALHALLAELKKPGARIFGIGAPSRASTLIAYTGLDDGIIDAVMEVSGSYKLDRYIPGTRIPVCDEARLYAEQPDYALLLSWHIADELAQNLRKRGFKGRFIVPLPEPRIMA